MLQHKGHYGVPTQMDQDAEDQAAMGRGYAAEARRQRGVALLDGRMTGPCLGLRAAVLNALTHEEWRRCLVDSALANGDPWAGCW
jgi:hypothetical protein